MTKLIKMNYMKKNNGFTLIETLIVVVTFAVILSVYANWRQGVNARQEMNSDLQRHAEQLRRTYVAINSFLNTNYSSIADDSRNLWRSYEHLRSDGFLPDGFGEQYVTNGTNDHFGARPLLTYSKLPLLYKDETRQVLRGIFMPFDAATFSYPFTVMSNKHGKNINNLDDARVFASTWYKSLVSLVKDDIQIGVIQKATLNVTGVSSSFTHTINHRNFNITPVDYDRIVMFWGFPDINGCAGGIDCNGQDINPNDIDLGNCDVTPTPTFDVNNNVAIEACHGNPDQVLYSTYPHPRPGNYDFSGFENVKGYGVVGWVHQSESIQVLGDFVGPSGLCTFYSDILGDQGLDNQWIYENQCLNSVVSNKIDSIIGNGATLASDVYETSGSYRFPIFNCAAQDPFTPGVEECGGNIVNYSVSEGHKHFTICCTD